jgi:hypothetical protein
MFKMLWESASRFSSFTKLVLAWRARKADNLTGICEPIVALIRGWYDRPNGLSHPTLRKLKAFEIGYLVLASTVYEGRYLTSRFARIVDLTNDHLHRHCRVH